jgi:hypothetical protein
MIYDKNKKYFTQKKTCTIFVIIFYYLEAVQSDIMGIKLVNSTGKRSGRFVTYIYGEDLFGFIYLDKFKGREKAKLSDKWVLRDVPSLFKVLDIEMYKREIENYETAYVY